MENEVADIVGEVQYTDSQKSVTTSNVYSLDFTDSSSDKNISSGKETYVIEQSDSDSEIIYQIHSDESTLNLNVNGNKHIESELKNKINTAICTSLQQCAIPEDTFTQTSKTIFELKNEVSIQSNVELKNLETQTSFMSVTEKSMVKYTIQVTENQASYEPEKKTGNTTENKLNIATPHNHVTIKSIKDKSFCIETSEANNVASECNKCFYDENFIKFTNYDSKHVSSESYNETLDESIDDVESWNINSDIEEDSLMENEYLGSKINQDNSSDISDTPESVENDVEQLYLQISANTHKLQPTTILDSTICNIDVLTPLTEETNKNESILDITPSIKTLTSSNYEIDAHDSIQTNFKISTFMNGNKNEDDKKNLKLPPIYKNLSCPNSQLVSALFSIHTPQIQFHKSNALPSLFEDQQRIFDQWEYRHKNLASGESPHINQNNAIREVSNLIQLPPVHNVSMTEELKYSNVEKCVKDKRIEEISIKERIKDLKMNNLKSRSQFKSRSCSPTSDTSQKETKLCDAAEKGCDALCFELLRQLRSCAWTEVAETLTYLPKALETFWPVISENRIADLLRQLSSLVESPRTQVARTACDAIAQVLKNTNYTKKPDFYEAISILLTKTSSFNPVVRRAANLGLDDIVCNVELTHSVTAICVYGVEHKSPRVRCASARLLIVCCALAEGGRQLLKGRPPTAATARRHVLRALAVLLQDKNLETRKYAERLYSMLRPLPNFEAYFLTDVNVELATEHMKKYDFLLKIKSSR